MWTRCIQKCTSRIKLVPDKIRHPSNHLVRPRYQLCTFPKQIDSLTHLAGFTSGGKAALDFRFVAGSNSFSFVLLSLKREAEYGDYIRIDGWTRQLSSASCTIRNAQDSNLNTGGV